MAQSQAPQEFDASQEGLRHVVRFVEWFQEPGRDLWLVFRDEGVSLHALMYNHVALGAEQDAGRWPRRNKLVERSCLLP